MKKIIMLMLLALPAGANAFINQITKLNADSNRQLGFCGKSYSLVGVTSCSSQPVAGVLSQIRSDYATFGIQYNPQTGQYSANTGNGYDPNFCDCPAPYILTPNSLVVSCTNHVTGSINGQPNITGVMIKISGSCSQRMPVTDGGTSAPSDGGTAAPSDGGTSAPSDGGTSAPSDGGTSTPPCSLATWQHAGIQLSNFMSSTVMGVISMPGVTQTSHTNQFADCAAARPFTDAWIAQNYTQIVQVTTQAANASGACPAGTITRVADRNTILNQCGPSGGSNPTGDIRFRVWSYPVPVSCCNQ